MSVGFAPEEIATGEPTRSARLKWVVAVNDALGAGLATNAAICVASATACEVAGLVGPDGKDAGGAIHPGLPWAGCSVLRGSAEDLRRLRERAGGSDDVFVADMPAAAQRTRVYDEYLETLAATASEEVEYNAVSVVGPRNRVAKLVKGLPLLG
ncbi:DUF2000 domain-containing protein [Pseudonocardia kujensis]|uniref:DUF2000 domain-containing protein n=1 Tax=Pseudonocardia kujensis TaxID=1128675 RepID=UPI001E53E784|nr:DUF2000 domain-containing protein [Pseudonocardia kujensis]MCE0768716.1 DUF2000 domain-containing protein [Pseudonocardia kujensis]